jgi:hypothetical protein
MEKEIIMFAKNKWLIGAGVVIGLIVLFALPFAWHALFPLQGYGMVRGYGMRGGFGFGMTFMWVIPLALLTLIGLGIAALIKYLRAPR